MKDKKTLSTRVAGFKTFVKQCLKNPALARDTFNRSVTSTSLLTRCSITSRYQRSEIQTNAFQKLQDQSSLFLPFLKHTPEKVANFQNSFKLSLSYLDRNFFIFVQILFLFSLSFDLFFSLTSYYIYIIDNETHSQNHK